MAKGFARGLFPEITDFTNVSNQEVSKFQLWINKRPRETLGYKNPIETIK